MIMADTYSIKGGADCKWGVAATSDKGTVLSHDVEESAKFEPFENAQGAVTGIIIYDTETVVRITVVALATATLPATGSAITVDGVTATVLKAKKTASSKDKVKFEIEANKWANLALT
jgi:hypothetical protein